MTIIYVHTLTLVLQEGMFNLLFECRQFPEKSENMSPGDNIDHGR